MSTLSNDCSVRKTITDLPPNNSPPEGESYIPVTSKNISGRFITYKVLVSNIPILGNLIRTISNLNPITSFPSDSQIPIISRSSSAAPYTVYRLPITSLPVADSVTDNSFSPVLREKIQLSYSELQIVTNTTLLDVNKNINCFINCSSDITITLPANAINGRRYFFKRIDTTSSKVKIATQGNVKIDFLDEIQLEPLDSVTLYSIQSNYYIT